MKKEEILRNQVVIDSISKIREDNNRQWMAILKLAFKVAPVEAKSIFSRITKNDMEINQLSKELCK